MANSDALSVSDFHKLALLDLFKIAPKKTEHNGRYWAFFSSNDARKILDDYDSGQLNVNARDFVSSITRVKDRIFESERSLRAKNGIGRDDSHR